MVAVILCVITAFEVGMYFIVDDIPRGLYIAILLTMAITKFVIVVSWFMHLRTDRPIFRRLFTMGSIGAIVLYTVVLATLHVFE
jgi:cytochrome c oxidase subunit 4